MLAAEFKQDWIVNDFIHVVKDQFKVEKKGYNYRICCLYSLAAVMPHLQKDEITQHIIPAFVTACKDDIPNVRFCVSRIIHERRQYIDQNVFNNQLVGAMKEMTNDSDRDVSHFATVALQGAP